jgi:hypothetical protein
VPNSLEEDYQRVSERLDEWLAALGYEAGDLDSRMRALSQAVQDGHFPTRWAEDYRRLHQLAHSPNLDPPSRTVGHLLAKSFDRAWNERALEEDADSKPEKPWQRLWKLIERRAR